MSHNLDVTNGQAAFVSAHTPAWHQLGRTLDHSFTAEEAMEEGLLGGWDVRKVPLLADVGGVRIPVEGRCATVRTNPVTGEPEVLGDVGDGYEVIQNEDHAGLLNALVDESGANLDTAGALDGGRRVFLSMKLPGHINVGGVDPVQNYINAVNSHDGSLSFTMMVTPIRVVCSNTLNLAFQNTSHIIRVRHTSRAQNNLQLQAREALDISFNYLDGFQQQADQLINATLTESRFEEIITREFGAPEDGAAATHTRAGKKIEEMLDLFAEADTQENIRGTAWAGLNAITEWYDHFAPTRGDARDTSRAVKAVFDPKPKNRALELMLAVL